MDGDECMNKVVCVTLLFFIFLTGCSNVKEPKEEDQEASILYSEPEVIVEMLNVPWSIDKEGSALYLSERPGSIVKVEDGKWQRQKIDLEKKLATVAEAGLLGFVLAPEFSKSKRIIPTILSAITRMGEEIHLKRMINYIESF
jgi:glucose/arabinose dehydrogenase